MEAQMLSDLSRNVRKIDHPFFAFHWVRAASLGITPSEMPGLAHDPRALEHLRKGSDSFFKTDKDQPGQEVHGFYVAIDPFVSSGYGGQDGYGILYRLEIPANFRYLDEISKDLPMPDEVRRYLKSQGCDPTIFHLTDAQFNYAQLIHGIYTPRCSQVIDRVIRKLNIDAIRYSYGGVTIPGCRPYSDDPRKFDQSAFILVRSNGIDPSTVRISWDGTPSSTPEGHERLLIKSIDAVPLSPEAEAWKKAHLLNCQPSLIDDVSQLLNRTSASVKHQSPTK